MTEAYSADLGSIRAMRRGNSAGTGSASVTVQGSSLGLVGITAMVRSGQTGCEGTEWESETSIRCLAVRSVGHSRGVRFTVMSSVGSSSHGFSFDSDLFTGGRLFNMKTQGMQFLSVFGSFWELGRFNTVLIRLGSTSCEGTKWMSASSIFCKAPGGFYASYRLTVTMGGVLGSLTDALTYDYPDVSGLGLLSNLPTYQADQVSIFGVGFGRYVLSQMANTGNSACEMSKWISDTSLCCKATMKVSASLPVYISIGARRSAHTEVISYDHPTISSHYITNSQARGRTLVTMFGQDMGPFHFSPVIRFGYSSCETTIWNAGTAVVCRTAHMFNELGQKSKVAITTGISLGSITELHTIDLVDIRKIGNSPATGAVSVKVYGTGMSGSDYSAIMLRLGETASEVTIWDSETTMRCKSSQGRQGTKRATITTSSFQFSMSQTFSVDIGQISVMRRNNREGTGSASVTVHGSSLGRVSYTAMVRSGQTGCEETEWESETLVRCKVGHGARGTRRVVMTAGERSGSGTAVYSMDTGRVSMTGAYNRAGTGSASVTVHGAGFVAVAITAMVRSGQTGCEETEW